MNGFNYQRDFPIAALASGREAAAIAIVRCSGAGTFALLRPLFSNPAALQKENSHRAQLGWLLSPAPVRERIDQILLIPFTQPNSYTGEESVELHCHGGRAVVERVEELLFSAGFSPALPGEFSYRAFINGKLDLSQAEAIAQLTAATRQQQRLQALGQLGGGLKNALSELQQSLLQQLALIEVQLDYDEDEFQPEALDQELLARQRQLLQSMVDSYQISEIRRRGLRVILVGAVNAGKSSLFNLLLKQQRALVSASPGTTRDFIDAELCLDDCIVHLHDTAGLRCSSDEIEQQGIALSKKLIAGADLLLLVADGSSNLTAEMTSFIASLAGKPWIGIWNKADLMTAKPPPAGWLALSCLNGSGLSNLKLKIQQFLPEVTDYEGVYPINRRQYQLILQVSESLDELLAAIATGVSWDLLVEPLRYGCDCLGELLGSKLRSDLLEEIFSQFCLGK